LLVGPNSGNTKGKHQPPSDEWRSLFRVYLLPGACLSWIRACFRRLIRYECPGTIQYVVLFRCYVRYNSYYCFMTGRICRAGLSILFPGIRLWCKAYTGAHISGIAYINRATAAGERAELSILLDCVHLYFSQEEMGSKGRHQLTRSCSLVHRRLFRASAQHLLTVCEQTP
jgi:hypothetical protein